MSGILTDILPYSLCSVPVIHPFEPQVSTIHYSWGPLSLHMRGYAVCYLCKPYFTFHVKSNNSVVEINYFLLK